MHGGGWGARYGARAAPGFARETLYVRLVLAPLLLLGLSAGWTSPASAAEPPPPAPPGTCPPDAPVPMGPVEDSLGLLKDPSAAEIEHLRIRGLSTALLGSVASPDGTRSAALTWRVDDFGRTRWVVVVTSLADGTRWVAGQAHVDDAWFTELASSPSTG